MLANTWSNAAQGTMHRYFGAIAESLRPATKPKWATNHVVVWETKSYKLLQFSGGSGTPSIIFPPQAGHSSHICDLSESNSLVRAIIKIISPLYAVEWKPGQEHAEDTLDSLIAQTHDIVCKTGSRANLIGLCQGAWQTAIYTALRPENVATLTVAGGPIDTKAGGGKLQEALSSTPLAFFPWLMWANGGTYPGEMILFGFKMMNFWDRFCFDYLRLFEKYGNEGELSKHRIFSNWYESTQDLPEWFEEVIQELFVENRLPNGKLEVSGRKVDLRNIKCPLFMVAGTSDDITLPDQVFAMDDLVGTPEGHRHRFLVDSGHIGLFMGSKALEEVWPKLAALIRTYEAYRSDWMDDMLERCWY